MFKAPMLRSLSLSFLRWKPGILRSKYQVTGPNCVTSKIAGDSKISKPCRGLWWRKIIHFKSVRRYREAGAASCRLRCVDELIDLSMMFERRAHGDRSWKKQSDVCVRTTIWNTNRRQLGEFFRQLFFNSNFGLIDLWFGRQDTWQGQTPGTCSCSTSCIRPKEVPLKRERPLLLGWRQKRSY